MLELAWASLQATVEVHATPHAAAVNIATIGAGHKTSISWKITGLEIANSTAGAASSVAHIMART